MFVVAGRCWCSQRSSRFCIRLAFDSQHDGWFSSIQMFPCCFPAAEPSVSLSGRRARVSRPLRSASRPAAARRAAWPNVSNWHLRRSWVRDSLLTFGCCDVQLRVSPHCLRAPKQRTEEVDGSLNLSCDTHESSCHCWQHEEFGSGSGLMFGQKERFEDVTLVSGTLWRAVFTRVVLLNDYSEINSRLITNTNKSQL